MTDLAKYVYNGAADSMGIPLFMMIGTLTFIGIIYYPAVNILSFITFNTKIRCIFYNVLWVAASAILGLLTKETFISKFTYVSLIVYACYFIWAVLIIYAIGYNKNKEKEE